MPILEYAAERDPVKIKFIWAIVSLVCTLAAIPVCLVSGRVLWEKHIEWLADILYWIPIIGLILNVIFAAYVYRIAAAHQRLKGWALILLIMGITIIVLFVASL
jgi:hypothetical protein